MSIYTDIGLNSSSSTSSTASTTAAATKKSDQLTQTDFLKLLTTQLSYQDPSKPADTTQMVSQMAQISMVSGITQLNTTTSGMNDVVTSSQALMASGLVGQSALVNSSTGYLPTTGTLDGVINTNGANVSNLKISITDSSGAVVREYTDPNTENGKVPFAWDGLDSNGNRVAAGAYKIAATGVVDGKAQALNPQVYGAVQSVTLGNTTTPTTVSLQGMGSYSIGQLLEISK